MSQEIIEYLFFNMSVAKQFKSELVKHNLVYSEVKEPVQNAIVFQVSEHMPEEVWDELDELYDELSDQDRVLLEEGVENAETRSTAGIYLQLAGGKQTVAQVDPLIMNKILSAITLDELNNFVDTIVKSVEKPDDSPICRC